MSIFRPRTVSPDSVNQLGRGFVRKTTLAVEEKLQFTKNLILISNMPDGNNLVVEDSALASMNNGINYCHAVADDIDMLFRLILLQRTAPSH